VEEEIEPFFVGKATDSQQARGIDGANAPGVFRRRRRDVAVIGIEIDGVGEDYEFFAGDMEVIGEVRGHRRRLAEDCVGAGIERSAK
jgi:hypothetical protein